MPRSQAIPGDTNQWPCLEMDTEVDTGKSCKASVISLCAARHSLASLKAEEGPPAGGL